MDELEFRFDLQRFAGDGGPNAGGDDGGNDDGKDGKTGGDDGKKVEFTAEQQAHIDQLISQRLKRAESAAAKKALEARAKELGYESAAEMEAALNAHKEAQEKQKTDLQKAQEAEAQAKAQAKAAEERAKAALINAALMTEAAVAGFSDPNDAVKMADTSGIEVKDDGTVAGAKEAVEALVKIKPYLVKQEGGSLPGGGNPARQGSPSGIQSVAQRVLQSAGIHVQQPGQQPPGANAPEPRRAWRTIGRR